MSKDQEPDEISNLTKFIALAIATILMIAMFGIFALLSKDDEPTSFSCDTMTNPTPCPDPPDPDEELYEQLKQYPDDSY